MTHETRTWFYSNEDASISVNSGELIRFVDSHPSSTTSRLLLFLLMLEGKKQPIPNQTQIASSLRVTKQSISNAVSHLRKYGFWLDRWGREQCHADVESQVRDRLQRELGGLTEVATPVGRIDLLTSTELIEVKQARDWKSALGQVIAYGAFYPEHRKRLHLFAKACKSLEIIQRTCSDLGVVVTFEEVQ